MDPGNGSCAADVLSPTACTLRAAIMEANANGNPDETDTIVIPEAAVIVLAIPGLGGTEEGDLNITEDLEILGGNLGQPSAIADIKNRLSVINGGFGAVERIFRIENTANVLLRGLWMLSSQSPDNNGGGAVRVFGGSTLTLEQSGFFNNRSGSNYNGGAILVDSGATLVLDNTDFYSNRLGGDGEGAAIYNAGTTTISRSNFRGNSDTNSAQIHNAGVLSIVNSTLSSSPISSAVGITSEAGSTLSMDGVTVVGHTLVGVDISGIQASLSISRTAFKGNAVDCTTPAAFFAAIFNYNWFEEVNSDCSMGVGNQQGILGAGDLTDDLVTRDDLVTYFYDIPSVGSELVERGGTLEQGCMLTGDQRGEPRPYNGNAIGVNACDVGAVEFNTRIFTNGFENF